MVTAVQPRDRVPPGVGAHNLTRGKHATSDRGGAALHCPLPIARNTGRGPQHRWRFFSHPPVAGPPLHCCSAQCCPNVVLSALCLVSAPCLVSARMSVACCPLSGIRYILHVARHVAGWPTVLHIGCCMSWTVSSVRSLVSATARCLESAARCLCMLSAARCRESAARCLCMLSAARCLLHAVCCTLSAARCLLHVAFARCLLHVV